MSLPDFSAQSQLFSTAALSGKLFVQEDRYRLFAKLVYPHLAGARAELEKCYCAQNGRVAIEPVLLLGVSLLQHLEGMPDRQAVDALRYHTGWNFALNRQVGDELFHPTSLVNFRNRLQDHGQSTLGFKSILGALEEAGLVSRQSPQRLDSTQMFGRVSKMSRLDCVRESLKLALEEVDKALGQRARPCWWSAQWDRYVESKADYRVGSEALTRKLGEAGMDAHRLLEWLAEQPGALAQGEQARLLARVFSEQFELKVGSLGPQPKSKEPLTVLPADGAEPATPTTEPVGSPTQSAGAGGSVPPVGPWPSAGIGSADAAGQEREPLAWPEPESQMPELGLVVEPKGKGQLPSERVQNPHDPDATYGAKGQGEHKKEHVGYKVQVAETVSQRRLAPGEPTHNFIVGIVTHAAYQSDEAGALLMEAEQSAAGLEKPPVHYVDGAYVSAQKLVEAKAEGRELIGPAPAAMRRDGRFGSEDFQVSVEERRAICPAAKTNTQCSRLEEEVSGKVSYRFEFGAQCHDCALRERCVGKDQRHRTLVVGEHYSALQARRQEQGTADFKARMKHRNAIEGTQSELVRAHGLRHARSRGLPKVKLQNYFIGAACNVKRWIRLEAWKLRQGASILSAQAAPIGAS